MEKPEVLKTYELSMIIDANLPGPEKDVVLKDVIDVIVKTGGKLIDQKVWFEKQKIAFAIKKIDEGTYYLINFQSSGAAAQSIRATLRLKERVLRYMILSTK